MLWTYGRLACSVSIAMAAVTCASDVSADEPAKRFLNRLRDEGYYDLALKYLETSASRNRLPEDMKADLPLERIILLQQSLRTLKTQQQLDERMIAIEKGYRDFLAASPSHPRRSETQTKLGDLLLDRAQTALDESKKPENASTADSWRSKSRQAYTEAIELYNQIAEELKPILAAMAGAKINNQPNQAQLKQQREQYQQDYRQAQILQAKTMELLAQTYPPSTPDWRKWLEDSDKNFTALIDKMTSPQEAGRRLLSLKYQAEVQLQLGKLDDARNSFIRVAENEGEGIYRTYRVQAIAGIVRLDSLEKVAKYEAAVQRGEEAIKTMTVKEREEPEWLDLQLAVAEARLAWGKTIDERKEENRFRNNRKAARDLLQSLIKKKGPHLPKAKQALSEIGIETADKTDKGEDKLPVTKAWADTIKAARERVERAESEDDEVAFKDRTQAIQLYQRAFRLFRDSDSRDDLIEAKFLNTYLHLKTDLFWETIALSQELLASGKGSSAAQRSGGFALTALSKILSETTAERQIALMPTLIQLANQLNNIDPSSKEAQSAIDLLVKLDLIHKRFDDAEKHIAMGKGNSAGGGASMLGQILWSEYQHAAIEHRKNKTEETEEDQKLKLRAETLLKATWDAMGADTTDKNMVSGVNALAGIYLMSDRIEEALSVVDAPVKGAIALSNRIKDLDPAVQLESYRLKLQALVQAAGSGKQSLSSEVVTQVVQKMKELSGDNVSLLASALNNLAVKLQAKLETNKNLEDQVKLGGAFGVLGEQLISVSTDVATLDSVGGSILTLATKIQKDPKLASNAKPLMLVAELAFAKIAAKPEAELKDAKRKLEDIQFKLAMAKTGAGKYEEANAMFAKSLTSNPNNLRSQVEAAKNLQQWANGKDIALFKKAINGAEPDSKNVNAIWGWAKINNKIASRVADFKEVYFDTQLNIARILAAIALQEANATAKTQGLERALAKIRETHQFYPELGTPEIYANFEKLLREIQQNLGRPAAGFQEFKK